MKHKIYKAIFTILLIIAIVLLVCIIYKYGNRQLNENKNKETLEVMAKTNSEENNTNESTKIKMQGYEVIGKIKIDKIGIEYPIVSIETSNPEETKAPMKIAIVKYWGGNVNDFENLSIAGHNNYDGTMFGKTKNLEVGDSIELTDLNKHTISYQIYRKFVTDPNDISILKTEDNSIREVTLITCTNGNKERLILKAEEIK